MSIIFSCLAINSCAYISPWAFACLGNNGSTYAIHNNSTNGHDCIKHSMVPYYIQSQLINFSADPRSDVETDQYWHVLLIFPESRDIKKTCEALLGLKW